uniref:Uncharacterized protein n=1 Tax=Rhizophora mucronata TaxID=61149 RepID=A0A2P2P3L1_RHIMU
MGLALSAMRWISNTCSNKCYFGYQ